MNEKIDNEDTDRQFKSAEVVEMTLAHIETTINDIDSEIAVLNGARETLVTLRSRIHFWKA